MEKSTEIKIGTTAEKPVQKTVYPILFAISFAHLLNDLLQSIIPTIYPLIKDTYHLSFSQIGMITFTFQITASLLQPFVGNYTDKKPKPYSFVIGMLFTLAGIVQLAYSYDFISVLLSVACVGIGSSIFHPEASKLSFYASGGRRGLAQSIFQLGGNAGTAIGPLLVVLIVVPYGQSNVIWFIVPAFLGIAVLLKVGNWYKGHLFLRSKNKGAAADALPVLPRRQVITSIVILLVLIFSKYFYTASISNYFTFYLIDKFQLTVTQSQVYLFLFLASVAAGTLLGGPLGDRFGRKYVIWFSILGVAPFTLLLPYANLYWTGILIVIIGIILASAFSAIIVYAQELLPGKTGMISGLFFGFAFGMGAIGSALLGNLADHAGISFVYQLCSFLPLLGIITWFLPNLKKE